MKQLDKLVQELCNLPTETPWVEFKHNNYDADMIGRDISALANGAAWKEKSYAYMVWGIDDESHHIVGTDYNLQTMKKGDQELENWLRSLLSDNAVFEFHSAMCEGKSVGILIINRAMYRPVTFKKVDYIRVGSYTKKLDDYPSIQGTVWDKIRNQKFEDQYAQTDLNEEEIVQALNYITYFDLLENKLPLPNNVSNIIYYLSQANLIVKQDNGLYGITNLGALLLAKKLSYFKKLKRKMLRVVQYNGSNKMDLLRDETFDKGYAAIFEDAIQFIEALTPMKEVITNGIRKRKTAYPTAAIREILANSLIHQDFSISETGPLVEIFDNRIEITNPGAPLINIMRIIDTPPKSRNEKLASLMRELGICEEVGSGWDKVILSCELMQLPAPRIEIFEDATRVTIFSEIKFSDLTLEDRLWACYLHACIKYVQGEQISNHTLRERFGLKQTGSGSISRLIKEAVKQNYIKPVDPDTAPRYMKYIPSWA